MMLFSSFLWINLKNGKTLGKVPRKIPMLLLDPIRSNAPKKTGGVLSDIFAVGIVGLFSVAVELLLKRPFSDKFFVVWVLS